MTKKKGVSFESILTQDVLSDVCKRITGTSDYEVIFDDSEYNISTGRIEVYQIREQNLVILPERSRNVISTLGNVELIQSSLAIERKEFEQKEILRSPRYMYNLLEKLGPKKCALCGCEIPELIEAAHIWPVASIKHESTLDLDDRINHANSGSNGIWLCANHHTLFDEDIITIDTNGSVNRSNG